MEILKKKLNLEEKLIQYIEKLIDKNMKQSSLPSDKLELIIRYFRD